MNKTLLERCGAACELCGNTENLNEFVVAPRTGTDVNDLICVCSTCNDLLIDDSQMKPNHWRCLNDSMWSEVPAVKVVAWRVLNSLKSEGWPNDLLDMMYMEDDTLAWAKSGYTSAEDKVIHLDSNGAQLNSGDTVVLIKDLDVKGANFVAKRGTAVRNITLVHDNAEQIEGRVNGQKIVILTQYVKK